MDFNVHKMAGLIIELAKEGKTYREIKIETGVCNETIANILRLNNLTSSERKFNPLKKKIIDDYRKTKSYSKTSKRTGIEYSKVRYYVSKYYKGKSK